MYFQYMLLGIPFAAEFPVTHCAPKCSKANPLDQLLFQIHFLTVVMPSSSVEVSRFYQKRQILRQVLAVLRFVLSTYGVTKCKPVVWIYPSRLPALVIYKQNNNMSTYDNLIGQRINIWHSNVNKMYQLRRGKAWLNVSGKWKNSFSSRHQDEAEGQNLFS